MKILVTILTVILLAAPPQAWAAIGCTLSNPAQDLKYLFPEMTSYKEEARELNKLPDGETLFKNLRARLGSDLDPEERERLVAGQLEHLHAMRRYAQAARCRHAALSEYFGQSYCAEPCGACDVCLGWSQAA